MIERPHRSSPPDRARGRLCCHVLYPGVTSTTKGREDLCGVGTCERVGLCVVGGLTRTGCHVNVPVKDPGSRGDCGTVLPSWRRGGWSEERKGSGGGKSREEKNRVLSGLTPDPYLPVGPRVWGRNGRRVKTQLMRTGSLTTLPPLCKMNT